MKTFIIFIGVLLITGSSVGQSSPDLELEKLKWQQQSNQFEQDAIRSTEEATRRIEQKAKDLEETIKKSQDQDQEQAYQNTNEPLPSVRKELEKPYQSSDGAPVQFDPVKENLDRFTSSPCYNELGYIPGRDNERLYRECESRRNGLWGSEGSKYLYALGGLAGVFLILFIISHFQKRGGK